MAARNAASSIHCNLRPPSMNAERYSAMNFLRRQFTRLILPILSMIGYCASAACKPGYACGPCGAEGLP